MAVVEIKNKYDKELKRKVTLSISLSKEVIVPISDYVTLVSDDYEKDSEGNLCKTKIVTEKVEESVLRTAVKDYVYNIPELLLELSNLAKNILKNIESKTERIHLTNIIEGCKNWIEDDYQIIDEENE